MEILAIILGAAVVALALALVFALAKIARAKPDPSENFLQNDVANLRRDVVELSRSLSENLDKNSDNLRAKVDEKLAQTQNSMATQLENSRKVVMEIATRMQKLDDTNKRVVDVADELKLIQNVLTNNKTRGNLGEYYLENVLGNVLAPGLWQRQYKFRNGEIVDAIVCLRDEKILPIDSKFSLENYNKMVDAKDKITRENYAKKLAADLKTRVDETSKYIRPAEHTMDFAFMFIPSEALYYDAIVDKVGLGGASRNLIDYAFAKNVIIVSPTTLLAYLQTVLQGLRSLQIEEQAKEIRKYVGQLGQHIAKYQEYHAKLGNSIGTVVNQFNLSRKELVKVDKDVVKIAGGENSVEPIALDRPQNGE